MGGIYVPSPTYLPTCISNQEFKSAFLHVQH